MKNAKKRFRTPCPRLILITQTLQTQKQKYLIILPLLCPKRVGPSEVLEPEKVEKEGKEEKDEDEEGTGIGPGTGYGQGKGQEEEKENDDIQTGETETEIEVLES